MAKAKLLWSEQARQDLLDIRRYISRDNPRAASAFVNRLRRAAGRLRDFPEAGAVLAELDDPEVREIVHDGYRVVYRYAPKTVRILTVVHGARRLDRRFLS